MLHLDPKGELSVTLTTRSKHLRSHPGETALPGGRWEEGDGEGGEWTAVRLRFGDEFFVASDLTPLVYVRSYEKRTKRLASRYHPDRDNLHY